MSCLFNNMVYIYLSKTVLQMYALIVGCKILSMLQLDLELYYQIQIGVLRLRSDYGWFVDNK